jgi:hypothetical protein
VTANKTLAVKHEQRIRKPRSYIQAASVSKGYLPALSAGAAIDPKTAIEAFRFA